MSAASATSVESGTVDPQTVQNWSAPLVVDVRGAAEYEAVHIRGSHHAVGLDRALVLDGGVPAYVAAGGDVVRGRRAWALERQVRLVAGSLVLAGSTAGRHLSPHARPLAGGIGAGVAFSTLSDTCAMGSALARLPFDRAVTDPLPARTLDRLQRRRRGQ